jgi:hypothetical protein
MRVIDPVTWNLIEEAARAYKIELQPLDGRRRLRIRSPQGAWYMLKFFNQVQPWLFINLAFVPDYTPDSEYMEFGVELLPRE